MLSEAMERQNRMDKTQSGTIEPRCDTASRLALSGVGIQLKAFAGASQARAWLREEGIAA
jgi:hypothetical protein